MRKTGKHHFRSGLLLLGLFVLWTWLIRTVDVQPAGESGTPVGFATLNCRFHDLTGVHMTLYHIIDWLGLVPVFICMIFGVVGFVQLIRRKSLLRVDFDLIALGFYYVAIISCYLAFEMIPLNYRPILIDGRLEASYPSSTTLLVLSVMPTLTFQAHRRLGSDTVKTIIRLFTVFFSAFMVIGRLVSGVHWLTDIAGSLFLSFGLFCIYKALVLHRCSRS